MWVVYAIVAVTALTFAVRKYGWQLYHRIGRPLFIRRIFGRQRRAVTPPLVSDDRATSSTEHSVFQVYDDGSIISSRIEKPQTVINFHMCTLRT
jgi:hypothetical protein